MIVISLLLLLIVWTTCILPLRIRSRIIVVNRYVLFLRWCIFIGFFHIILNRKHVIVLYAISESLYCHFRSEHCIFPLRIFSNEILNIFSKRCADLEMRLSVFSVLVEGKDIIDVVDKCRDSDSTEGDRRRCRKILLMLFDKKVTIIQQEAIKLRKVLLLCHLVLFVIYTAKHAMQTKTIKNIIKSNQNECF